MTYERFTALPVREVLRLAEEVLTARLPISKVEADRHHIRLEGGDGSVMITGHRHGLETQVHAATDRLRTERLDLEVQYFMSLLPYQPGDAREASESLPLAISGR